MVKIAIIAGDSKGIRTSLFSYEQNCPVTGFLEYQCCMTRPGKTSKFDMTNVIENVPRTFYIRVMKSWARLILIFLAYGIALLHTVVPHHHAISGKSTAIFFHAGCMSHVSGGLLQRVLSTDLGYGHLENFRKNSEADIQFLTRPLVAFMLMPQVITGPAVLGSSSEFLCGYIEKLKKRLLLFSVSHLRAPPFFS